MKTVGAYDAKTHLAQLLDEVAAGETITITRRGIPVAQLVAPTGDAPPDVDRAIDDLIAFATRERMTLGDITLRELIEEGRRF